MLSNELKDSVDRLSNSQKRELCNYIILAFSQNSEDTRGNTVKKKMEEITGISLAEKNQTQKFVWARSMVAYQLREEGFTLEAISKVLGCTVTNAFRMEKKVQDLIDFPHIYKNIVPIWVEFKTAINEIH